MEATVGNAEARRFRVLLLVVRNIERMESTKLRLSRPLTDSEGRKEGRKDARVPSRKGYRDGVDKLRIFRENLLSRIDRRNRIAVSTDRVNLVTSVRNSNIRDKL